VGRGSVVAESANLARRLRRLRESGPRPLDAGR